MNPSFRARGIVLALATAVCWGQQAYAQVSGPQASYSALYAFGDSISDAGNAFASNAASVGPADAQPGAPYSEGRFSNGPVWVQRLAAMLGIGPVTASLSGGTDYAVGGAQTDATATGALVAIDLQSQLAAFRAAHPVADSGALYTLDIGGNDVLTVLKAYATGGLDLGQATATLDAAAASAAGFVGSLHTLGAQNLVFFGLPDMGRLPATAYGAAATQAASYAAARFNASFAADVALVQAAGMRVDILDEYASWNAVFARPAAYGFSDVTTPCYAGAALCAATVAGQDGHFFFDSLHPTEAAHTLFARDALLALTAAPACAAPPGNAPPLPTAR